MNEKQKIGISKFLNINYGNLITEERRNGKYRAFSLKKDDDKVFILDTSDDASKDVVVYVSAKYVIDPILNMFYTDYNETYDFVEEWFSEKYKTKCDTIIGF